MNDVTRYPVDTTLGTVLLQMPSGADYVYVEFGKDNRDSKRSEFRVRGVEYSGSLRLTRTEGGAWALDEARHSFNVHSRWNGKTFIPSTRATDDKIKQTVVPAVIAWLDAHPEVIEEARERQLQRDIDKATMAVAEARQALTEAEQTLAALLAREEEADA